MAVVRSGFFLILRRFPDCQEVLKRIYLNSDTFKSICDNYQKCSEAIDYWAESDRNEANRRYQEYATLLEELEGEIVQIMEEHEE